MLTIAAAPKPFTDPHIRVIQRNAIRSWMRLNPVPTIILFGKDAGIAETAAEFGVLHDPHVACSDFGTPLLKDIIRRAELLSGAQVTCFINSDILLVPRFMQAVEIAYRRKSKSFLIVGQCWNADVVEEIDFAEGWEEDGRVVRNRVMRQPGAIDYFVFPRGMLEDLPPFTIGRARYDNWMILNALQKGIPVVDATAFVKVIHQNHDYGHVPGGRQWSYRGPEATENLRLAGGWEALRSISDATHRLRLTGGIRRPLRTNVRALLERWNTWKKPSASDLDGRIGSI